MMSASASRSEVVHQPTQSPAEQQLIGAWKFVADEQRLPDGTTRRNPSWGPRGVGYIIYSSNRVMCAMLANPERPKWSAQPPSDADIRAAFQGLTAYCGRYEVNEQERFVVHHVEMDSSPNAIGTDRKRYFTLDGNRLLLRVDAPPRGVAEWTLTWERVQ